MIRTMDWHDIRFLAADPHPFCENPVRAIPFLVSHQFSKFYLLDQQVQNLHQSWFAQWIDIIFVFLQGIHILSVKIRFGQSLSLPHTSFRNFISWMAKFRILTNHDSHNGLTWYSVSCSWSTSFLRKSGSGHPFLCLTPVFEISRACRNFERCRTRKELWILLIWLLNTTLHDFRFFAVTTFALNG